MHGIMCMHIFGILKRIYRVYTSKIDGSVFYPNYAQILKPGVCIYDQLIEFQVGLRTLVKSTVRIRAI